MEDLEAVEDKKSESNQIYHPPHYCFGKYEPVKEIWKPIYGYEGLYEVSNIGKVRSLDRYVDFRGRKRIFKGRILKFKKAGSDDEYQSVALSKNGKTKYITVHRLVAIAFIPNPNNLPEVNHKDENPHNNSIENLEWRDRKYNVNYGMHNKKISDTKSKSLSILDLNGNVLKIYRSAKDASKETGFTQSGITHCCNGRLNAFKGYRWRYCDE